MLTTRGHPVNRDRERILDEYLVAAAVTGDRPALARLVARWQPRLLRHAWRVLGDGERARDVAAFPAWSLRIVTRRCQRSFRRRDREAFASLDEEPALEPAMPEHASAEFAADLAIVQAAIAELPPAQRAALALFYIEGLGVAEIAIALDVPPGTVKTRLMHARRKVRARLEETP